MKKDKLMFVVIRIIGALGILLFVAVFLLLFDTYRDVTLIFIEEKPEIIPGLSLILCIFYTAFFLLFIKHYKEKTEGKIGIISQRLQEQQDNMELKSDKTELEKFKAELAEVKSFGDQLKKSLNGIKAPAQKTEGPELAIYTEQRKWLSKYNQAIKDISELMKTDVAKHFENLRRDKVEKRLEQIDRQISSLETKDEFDIQSESDPAQKLSRTISYLMLQSSKASDIEFEAEIPISDLRSITKTFARYIDDEYKEKRDHELDIEEKFGQILELVGLEQIRPKKGEQLDPKYHEIEGEQRSEIPRNAIVRTAQRGFVENDKFTRARVIIAS